MKTDELLTNLKNAWNAEAAQTSGLDITKAVTYKIGLVIRDGDIVGYTIDKTEDYGASNIPQ